MDATGRRLDSGRVASGSGGPQPAIPGAGPQRPVRVAQVPAQRARGHRLPDAARRRPDARGRARSPPPTVRRCGGWAWQRDVDLVHLHWLEFIAPSAPGGLAAWLRTLIRMARLIAALTWLRLRGIKLVWTVHNLGPHEPVQPRLEASLGRLVSSDQPRASGALHVRPEPDPRALGLRGQGGGHPARQLRRAVRVATGHPVRHPSFAWNPGSTPTYSCRSARCGRISD